MKKIISIILALTLVFGISVPAWASQTISAKFTSNGETAFEGTLSSGTDEDGCQVFDLNLNSAGQVIAILAQLGQESLVIGQGETFFEIDYENLTSVLQGIFENSMGNQSAEITSYFSSADFQNDLQTITEALTSEMTRIMLLANQSGLVEIADDGEVTIKCSTQDFLSLAASYCESLSQNDTLFETLTATTLWQMLGLSADGKTEQAAIASAAESIRNIDTQTLAADISLNANIKADGTITANLKYAAEGMEENISLVYTGDSFAETISIADDNQQMKLDIASNSEKAILSFNMDSENMSISGNGTLDLSTYNFDGSLTTAGETVDITGRLDATENNGISYTLNGMMDQQKVFEIIFGIEVTEATAEKSLATAYLNINGIVYSLDIDIENSETMRSGEFSLNASNGQETMNIASLSISISQDDETYQHVSGEKVTKEQLTEMFSSFGKPASN